VHPSVTDSWDPAEEDAAASSVAELVKVENGVVGETVAMGGAEDEGRW